MDQPHVLHPDGSSRPLSWVEKQKVERDICLLYHQTADYSYLMGDLYYGDVYGLPYWDYLRIQELEAEDANFIRDGCLVMLLAMVLAALDGADDYIVPRTALCKRAVAALQPEDENTSRLVRAVLVGLDFVESVAAGRRAGDLPTERLIKESNWVHAEYVRGYYLRAAE